MSDHEDREEIKIRVLDYLEEFTKAIFDSLGEGEKKYGNLWLNFPRKNLEKRIEEIFVDKFDQFQRNDKPVNWASIAGYAMIAWIHENHPELWDDTN